MHFRALCTALTAFYSVIFLVNLLKVEFYLGYKVFTINITLLTPIMDKVLWAICGVLSVVLLLITYRNRMTSNGGVVRNTALLTIFYGMLVLVAVEVGALARWVYNLIDPSPILADGSWRIALTEIQITNILYPLLPVILMFFAFCWVGEFTFKGLLIKRENAKATDYSFPSCGFASKIPLIIGLVSVGACLSVGYYNFAIAEHFNPAFPGVDVHLHYTKYLHEVSGVGLIDALKHAAENDRFLYLAFQYFCFRLSGLPIDVFVTYVMPVILALLLMLATFLLVKVGRTTIHAATAMLATAFSFQVTVGLHTAFYANWFALTLVYAFYGLLILAFKGRREPWLLGLTTLISIAVLFAHPWTWILLVMMVPIVYIITTLLLIWIRKARLRAYAWDLKFLTTLLTVNLAMFYVRDFLGVGSGAEVADLAKAKIYPSLLNILSLKYFLDSTFNWYVGGFYACLPILILAILGVLSFLDYGDRYNRLLLTWILVASAMVFVHFPWHARFLYMTPFNIYVTFGMLYGAGLLQRFAKLSGMGSLAPAMFWIFYVLSLLLLLNYTVRSVAIKQLGPTGLTTIIP
jgi:hypothetical protein